MGPVKQMLAIAVAVGVAGCSDFSFSAAPADAPNACMMITRPLAPELVLHRADGVERKPLLRAACARITDFLLAWTDQKGTHLRAGTSVFDVDRTTPTVLGRGCFTGLAMARESAVLQTPESVQLVRADGSHAAVTLPLLLPGERIDGLVGTTFVAHTGMSGSSARFVGAEGEAVDAVFDRDGARVGRRDGSTVILDDGRRFDVADAEAVYVVGDTVVAPRKQHDWVAWLRGKPVTIHRGEPAWSDGTRMFVARKFQVLALSAEGGEEVVASSSGAERVQFDVDFASRRGVMVERFREADCSVRDRVSLFPLDGRGAPTVIADGPRIRKLVGITRDTVAWAEAEVAYEASGASEP